MFCLCFVMYYFVSFLVCNHLDEEESAGCFPLLSLGCLVTITVLCFFLMVTWVIGLLCDCGISCSYSLTL